MIVKITIFLFVSWASANPVYQTPVYGNLYDPSYVEKTKPYSSGFDVKDEYGTTLSRIEIGDELGNKQGSYGYIDAYGIARQVDYIADDKGFRAVVRTNEPGTDNQNPADVQIQSDAVKSQPTSTYSSSVPLSSAYSRPVPSAYGIAPVVRQPVRQIISDPVSAPVSLNSYGSPVKQPVSSLY